MDITIPPHNLKRFTAAITCLGKIGKDLYVSFDPLDGLILSFGKFHFDPTFFDRCSAPPVVVSTAASAASDDDKDDDEFYDSSRYVCRVPVRSVHAILRPRKGVCSLRIRSEGMDDEGNHFGLNRKRKRRRNNQKQQHRGGGGGDNDNDENDNDEREQQRPYSVRRNRKKRKSNKRNNNNNDNGDTENTDGLANNNDKMMLSFEFIIEHITKNNQNGSNSGSSGYGGGDGTFRVIHKVGVTDANGIKLSASTRKRDRSEIVSPPKLWLRLLDPLRRTAEVALTIDDELKVVTATSFHPGEIQQQQQHTSTEDNAVLQAAAAKAAVLKTETSTGTEEFDEYDFRNNRGRKKNRKKKRRNGGGGGRDDDDNDDDTDDDNEEDEERESEIPPPDVNQKVILVFSIKEAKAMLQYCAQTNSTFHDDGDALSIISFHWGGKPIVIETDGDSFSGELVLATLHHGMITSNITVGSNRRESSG